MWWILGILLIVILTASIRNSHKRYVQRQNAIVELLCKIEEKYQLAWNSYYLQVKDKITKTDMNSLLEETYTLIKPEINAIFDLINEVFLPNFQVAYQSSVFGEAILKIENLCKQRVKSRKSLDKTDLKQLQETFKDCLRANLLENKIRWNLE
jgi:hypothetical protein